MDKYLQKFCKNTTKIKYLNKISPLAKEILITYCFRALNQKIGDQNLCKKILVYYNLIKILPDTIKNKNVEYIVYQGEDMKDNILNMERRGIITIPVYTKKQLKSIQKKFRKMLQDFPEYYRCIGDADKDHNCNPLVYVLGGFAALGNPSSFHAPLVRIIRKDARKKVIPGLFTPLIQKKIKKKLRKKTKLEMLFDRTMFRMKGQKASAESWHRDVMPKGSLNKHDEVYGGWINLDNTNQYFSCIPGSHLGLRLYNLHSGFDTIPKHSIKKIGKYRERFIIPPGHCVIFPQYLLHEVVSTPAKQDMMRLFLGWRTTIKNTPIHGKEFLEKIFKNQGVPPLPGGMIPPMYAANHGSFFLRKQFKPNPKVNVNVNLIEWSRNTFLPELLVEKHGKSGEYIVIKRHMDSLEEYGLKMYPKYSEKEKKMYYPSNISEKV